MSAYNDFSKATRGELAKRNYVVIGKQAAPADENDPYFTGTAYQLLYRGEVSLLRTYLQVIRLAHFGTGGYDPTTDNNK